MKYFLFLFVFAFNFCTYGSSMYVLSNKANIMSEPSMAGQILSSIPHGSKVNVMSTDGIWIEIDQSKIKGWICKFNLTENDPKKDSVLDALNKTDLNKKARRRASSYSTAATTRGFTEHDEKINADADYNALRQMIGFLPTVEEVDVFISEGGLQ
ncbi:MAG: SH3 domain-containing protein [Candidatus Margulisiibacteriota bacterium]